MSNLELIKSIRAQDYGVAGLSTTDVDWLIAEVERLTVELRASETESLKHALAVGQVCIELSEEKREVERLTADRDRYKAWHDDVASRRIHVLQENGRVYDAIVRPKPLKENE